MASIRESLLTMFLLGFDSLLAGLAIGPMLSSWRGWVVFVLLFGTCDGAATLLGASVPHLAPALPTAALYAIAVALIIQGARRSRAWLYAMPVLFSLDNLATGSAASDALAVALSSGAMAGMGLALGGLGRRTAIRFAAAGGPG
jgi:hypothetical protein